MPDYGYRNRLAGSAARKSLAVLLLAVDRLENGGLERLKDPSGNRWNVHFIGRYVSVSYQLTTKWWSVEWPGMETQAFTDAHLLDMLRHSAIPIMLTVVMGEMSAAAAAGHDLRGLELEAVASDVIEA